MPSHPKTWLNTIVCQWTSSDRIRKDFQLISERERESEEVKEGTKKEESNRQIQWRKKVEKRNDRIRKKNIKITFCVQYDY